MEKKNVFWIVVVLVAILTGLGYQYSQHDVANKMFANDLTAIAKGEVTGKTAVRKIGHNHALATANETVYDQSDLMTRITMSQYLFIASTSANDSTAGTGATYMTVHGLDGDFAFQEEQIAIEGRDTVRTANEYIRICCMVIDSVGSGGVTAGDITIKNTDCDTTLATISAGENRAYIGAFTVPATKTFYLTHLYASTAKGILTNVTLWVRPFEGAWYEISGAQVWLASIEYPYPLPFVIAAKTDIELRAKGNTSEVIAGFAGWYE